MNRAAPSRRAWTAFAWVGMCAFFLVAVWYVWRIGDPMPTADNWINLDVFLRKAYYHGVGISDFLWNRGAGDHSQPLDKALLWANARYFGLDFRLEGLFAMLLGLAAMLVLRRAALDGGEGDARWGSIGVVAIAAVFFSLNSSRIYSYSMITLWFSLYLGMFLSVLAAWKAMNGVSPAWLLAITFVFGVIADDVAYLAAASIALSLCLYGGRVGGWRRTAQVIGYCLAGFLLSRLFYLCFQGKVGGSIQLRTSPGGFLRFLASDYRDIWQWWAIPSASGLAQVDTMKLLVGERAAPWVGGGLAIVMLPMHMWFWWKAWARKPDLTGFMAVCVMLFYYAHVAGILYGRIPVFGTDYLNSLRYVSFYQLGVIALLLMLTAAAGDAARNGSRVRWAYAAPLVAVIMLQVAVAKIAFAQAHWIMEYQENKAYTLATMAIFTPEARQECMAFKELRNICASEERREKLGGLLVDNHLSVFSPQFQRRYPRLAVAAAKAGKHDR